MKNIAIIPARSGSKGLPDKNIKVLGNKPLLAYSILAAKESGCFDEICVSTDSEEYASIAREWGASVPFLRSEKTAGDKASSWDVVKEVLDGYRAMGMEFDTIALLQPTSPLRKAEDIQKGYVLMKENDAKAVIGVCEMDHSPLWSNTLPENLSMRGFIREEAKNTPRQSLPTYYRINGALYIIKKQILESVENMYEDECYAYVMSQEKSVDIDTAFDFQIAQLFMGESK